MNYESTSATATAAELGTGHDHADDPWGEPANWLVPVALAAVLLAGLVIRVAFIQAPGYRDDMVIFYSWFKSIAVLPPGQVYAGTPDLNYPPGYIVLTELSALILHWFVPGTPSVAALNVVLKLPAILFDIAGAALAFVIVRRLSSLAFALAAAAFIAFNPAIIYDSAFWGQDDSIPAVLALFAVFLLWTGKPIVAWLCITFAILVKPPVLVLVPLLLLYPLVVPRSQRRSMLWQTAAGIVGAFALTELLALAFFAHPTPVAALRHLLGQLVGGSSYFPVNSLNSFNVWAIFAPFMVSDKTRFLGVSMHVWGTLLFCATAALIYWRYVQSRSRTALFEASALVLLGFFLLLTEMHERYLLYAVLFLGVLLFERPYRFAALLFTLTLLLDLEYGLTFMYLDDARATMINRYEFAPWLIHLCSIANVGVFGALLANYLGLRLPSIARNNLLRATFAPDAAGTRTRSSA